MSVKFIAVSVVSLTTRPYTLKALANSSPGGLVLLHY